MDLVGATGRDTVDSVHLAQFPVCDESIVDKELEMRMELAQKVSSMGLALRKKVNIIVKQPLQKLMIPVDAELKARLEAVKPLIMNEVNVKEIDFVEARKHDFFTLVTRRLLHLVSIVLHLIFATAI